MSLANSCHRCAQPYDDCKCDMFKTKLCKKCGNPEEDLGYCCNESQRNEPTPTEVGNDGVFIQRVKVGDTEVTSKCEPVNTLLTPKDEYELHFAESKKEDWVDLGAHYRHSFQGHKIDVYRVLEIFEVTCPIAQHVIKKLLRGEKKGHTMDFVWNEVKQAVERKFEMMEEDNVL